MYYKKHKRQAFGLRNICRTQANLTWDHVPPKGGIELRSVEIESIQQIMSKSHGGKKAISQDGVKYRTICKKCNETLGHRYDPVLNELNRKVALFLKSNLHLPPVIQFETKPTALIRGVLGHLLAAKLNPDDSQPDSVIRTFLFDDSLAVPDEINIFYWVYPYDYQLILRDFTMLKFVTEGKIITVCNLLKFFPVAYLVTSEDKFDGLPALTNYRDLRPSESAAIPLPLTAVRESDWPERVDEKTALFMGQAGFDSVSSKPRKKKP